MLICPALDIHRIHSLWRSDYDVVGSLSCAIDDYLEREGGHRHGGRDVVRYEMLFDVGEEQRQVHP
jgi:hypothetical protein